jgi:cardiolipin synthase A/B
MNSQTRPSRNAAAKAWLRKRRKLLIGVFIFGAHLLGAITSVHAILTVRTSQGSIAWAVSLNTFPYVAVPAYWIFGRADFEGYVMLRRAENSELSATQQEIARNMDAMRPPPDQETESTRLMQKLAMLPATRGNHAELLVDGKMIFDAIFASIAEAREYVLAQFYIIHDDALGRRLKDALLAKARAGVRCYLLFDEIGSAGLPAGYVRELTDAGVQTRPFNTRQGATNRFQINFRNHRKTVVVDGRVAFVGGANVGDEYLGLDPKIGAWRDTHVKVTGPVTQCVQLAWLEDWKWATKAGVSLNWKPEPAPGADGIAFCLPSGPADKFETCTLFFLHAIHAAKKRVWIASPYFVPDEQFISALQLAALRGVDVRILLPGTADNALVQMSSYTFLPELEKAGVQTWRYNAGFLHEKALLVDDVAGIGTANFDNRSFRLNFEITMLFTEPAFVRDVEKMFAADFAHSTQAAATEFTSRPWWFRLVARTSRLMAPVQ